MKVEFYGENLSYFELRNPVEIREGTIVFNYHSKSEGDIYFGDIPASKINARIINLPKELYYFFVDIDKESEDIGKNERLLKKLISWQISSLK